MPAQASCCLPASWLVLWVAAVAMGAAEVAEFITIALQPYTAGMQPTQAQPRRQLQLQSNRTTTRDGWSGPDLPGPLFILVRSYTPAAWNLRLGYALPAGRFLIQRLTQTSDFVYPLRAQSLPTYRKIYLDKYCTCVLTFRVIVSRHSRRTFPSFSPRSHSHFGTHPSATPLKIAPFFSCAYGSLFCNPFFFKFMQEWGVYVPPSSTFRRPKPLLPRQHFAPLSPLAATLMKIPASVANKRLTPRLNPSDATLTKNRGEGQTVQIISSFFSTWAKSLSLVAREALRWRARAAAKPST